MLRTTAPTRPRSLDELLDGPLVAKLNQLDITSKKVFQGKVKGERRSKRRGQSVEFADHRQYVVGDDLRRIDWNIFGRLDRLFLKLFMEEEDLSLHIVVDASESMATGEPEKFIFAQKAAAALAYIGLVNMNRVAVTAIGGNEAEDADPGAIPTIRNLRGRRRLSEVGHFLTSLDPVGKLRFDAACKRIALSRQGKGVMVVLSDFFFKEGYDQGLRYLVGRGYDIVLIQVLSPQEVEPPIGGDLRLRDVEDADITEVTISAPLLKRYKANLTAYCDQLRDFCARREMVLLTMQSDTPIETLLLDYLRRRGVLR